MLDVRVLLLLCIIHIAQSKILELSCSQIRQFVDGHNSRRLQLARGEVYNQPPAAEMKYMVWDEGLARKARAWASHNDFSHNPDQTDIYGRFDTGENIHYDASTNLQFSLNVDSSLSSWFDEHKHYTYGPMKKSNNRSKAIGHYTQMAWSDSIYVGCGVSEFMNGNMKEFLVVCNYGPTGNYIGQTPYKAGRGSGQLQCASHGCKNPYGSQC